MDNQKDPRSQFVPRHLPWLLGIIMFLIYCATLNHWVTLLNLAQTTQVCGWDWQPILSQPLLFLATLPFKLLPAARIPVALNLFSAATAALSLALLARSVAILPHDRTEIERQRERSDFSFLTGWVAYFPPILAVLMVGLQLTFWEHATSFTGESFDLLPLALVIWLLLEYRLNESAEWRLFAAAAIYGAGMAESWSFICFFPLFLAAIVWIRGWSFFNFRFLSRMSGYGLAGLAMLFLMPLIGKFSGQLSIGFWGSVRQVLAQDWMYMKLIANGDIRHDLLLLSLSSFLPVLMISIRWSANFGDTSQTSRQFLKYFLYLVNGLLFVVCVWIMFDPPFSPRQIGLGPSLSLYFLSALSLGYLCGYFLLVFGIIPHASRRRRRPDPALPAGLAWLNPVIVIGTFLAAAVSLTALAYKNLPVIRQHNDNTLLKYAQLATQNLPPTGAILLVDGDILNLGAFGSSPQPIRRDLIQAVLARENRMEKFPVVDTRLLEWKPYQRFLHRRFPAQWPAPDDGTTNNFVRPIVVLHTLDQLSKSHALYYLNPSFGYYFEMYYQEPHGLVYTMKYLPDATLLPPPWNDSLLAENQTFWSNVTQSVSGPIVRALTPPDPNRSLNLLDWFLMHLHAPSEPNQNAVFIGTVYSRALNYWGVQLQQAGRLDDAAAQFSAAEKTNPDNTAARVNLDFNQALRTGAPLKINPESVNSDAFGKANTWNEILNADGPFDEINYCFFDGLLLADDNHFYRQAAAQFTRVKQLAPNNLETRLQLAQIYIFNRLPDRALAVLHDPLTEPARFSLTKDNSTSLNVLTASAYFQKNDNDRAIELLQREISLHPDDEALLQTTAQAYMLHGLYTNALKIIDFKLRQTPNDLTWLTGRSLACFQAGDFPQAIDTLTRILKIQTNDPTAQFNRALAYLKTGQLAEARADYLHLQSAYTNIFQIAFGLGEIAWRQRDTNEAVRNYKIYLANAPTNTAEAAQVVTRLHALTTH